MSNSNPNQSSSQSSPEKTHESIFRVNRLSQEIFSGNRQAFEEAIRTRRIKADDLIFDEDSQTWIFARQHAIFMQLLGQSHADIRKYEKKKFNIKSLQAPLISILLITAFLFIIVRYSKEIQFKQSEASSEFDPNVKSKAGAGVGSEESESGKNKGKGGEGDEAGEGGSDNGTGGGGDMKGGADSDLQAFNETQSFRPKEDTIEMVFDLDADGMKQAIQFVQENQGLDDEKLLLKAHQIKNSKLKGREVIDLLQQGMAYASFVLNRSLQQKRMPHRNAEILLEQLRDRLKSECMSVHSPSFCDIKATYPKWSESVIDSILKRNVTLGMTLQQAEMAWKSADRVIRDGKKRKYCYRKDCEQAFWVSQDGVVVDILP